MQELNDKFKGEETDLNEKDPKRAQFRRACLVISGAEGIGLAPLIRANHITGKAHLYNIAFVAQLLNRRPRIHRESLHLDASIKMQVGQGCDWIRRRVYSTGKQHLTARTSWIRSAGTTRAQWPCCRAAACTRKDSSLRGVLGV